MVSGHVNLCNLLLHNLAQVNLRSKGGLSALHIAASLGHISCIKLLMNYGADVTLKDNNGDTPLHLVRKHSVAIHVGSLSVAANIGS